MRSSSAFARRSAETLVPLALLALCLHGVAAAEPGRVQGELDLEKLMHYFATSRGLEAEFREEKTLPLLVEPMRAAGVIYFAPPDRMARFTFAPEQSSLLVTGDRLRIEDSLGVEEVDLAAQPTARQFVDQLLVLFRGDLAALRRDYEVQFQGGASAWQLRLASRSARVRQLIREVVLRGSADHLDEMVVSGADGEVTRTTYQRALTDRPFRAEELAQIFPKQGSPRPLATGSPTP